MSEEERFVYTTSLSKIRKLKKRVRVIQGGTSSSKTWSILPILIDIAARTPNTSISVVSESLPHLRKGAIRDFLTIMRLTKRYIDDHWNRSTFTYTFANGSFIEFFPCDTEQKARGPRRQYLFVNEANALPWDIYFQLAIRTSHAIFVDYNPSHRFWAHENLIGDDDTDFLILTYKDNEALSETLVKELEKALPRAFHNPDLPRPDLYNESNVKNKYWANWCKVYLHGEVGSLEGVVFQNWDTIKEIPAEARLLGYGVDFGFSNDPTAIVALYEYEDQVIFDEVVYKTGMLSAEIAKHIPDDVICYADSADPRTIAELVNLGKYVYPVTKGPDSIINGIQFMQGLKMIVTERSVNMIKELRNYSWDEDKHGKRLNKPVDAYNHAIDAARYACVMHLGQPDQDFFVMSW